MRRRRSASSRPFIPPRHHDVGDQKVDSSSLLPPHIDRTRTALRLQQTVAEILEQLDDERPYAILVLDDENRLVSARRWRGTREPVALRGGGSTPREERAKRRAAPI